jgi:crotonobetainyl-CoA:carnitine CoA-transferase CaiB-like acyl-CoA transferase
MAILSGYTVLEFSEVFQAPVAAQVLGDFGADVIKVERPEHGDLLRGMDAHANAQGLMCSYFAAANRNKQSILLNLKSAAGKAAAHHLAQRADVLIHNYRPGAMDRLGLGFEELAALNPRLVYAEATGYGESGPLARMGGQDMAIQSLSGIASGSAGADGAPQLTNTPVIDFTSGMVLAQGIVLALLERERSGLGQRVSTSLLDTAIAMQGLEASAQLMYGQKTKWFERNMNFIFQTRDGWITVLGFFRANPLQLICRALGVPDETQRPEMATLAQQLERREEIAATFRPHFLTLSTDEAIARLQEQDVICSPILDLKDALQHEQVRHNGMVATLPLDGQPDCEVVSNPLRMSRTPASIRCGPPALGRDTAAVLKRFGFAASDM